MAAPTPLYKLIKPILPCTNTYPGCNVLFNFAAILRYKTVEQKQIELDNLLPALGPSPEGYFQSDEYKPPCLRVLTEFIVCVKIMASSYILGVYNSRYHNCDKIIHAFYLPLAPTIMLGPFQTP